jgi:isopentenyl diphosphate isomerase/L-lactate dehydrogenase-like FMN-dependent dehydrogenase
MSKDIANLKQDIKDLLNHIAIKLKDIPRYSPQRDDNDRYTNPLTDQDEEVWDEVQQDYVVKEKDNPLTDEDKDRIFLQGVKNWVDRAVSSEPSVIENENQYYNSNC